MVHLNRPWQGSPPVTQNFGPTDYAGEPAGYWWPDSSISYFTPGGTRMDHLHCGLDLGLGMGSPLTAPADGVVEFAGTDQTGFGQCTKIRHDALGIGTLYGHQSEIDVHQGQTVKQGQPIGKVGSTGNSTAPHLHLSVYRLSDKHYVDPSPFLNGTPPPPPKPADAVTYVSFTVTTPGQGRGLTRVFDGPSDQLVQAGTIQPNTKVVCDAFMWGAPRLDPVTGQWDRRHYHRVSGGWIPSAHCTGNAPNSKP